MPLRMSTAERHAPEAHAEGGLEERRGGQEAEHDLGRGPVAEAGQHQRRSTEKTTPMPWAKRLGGPGTGRSAIPRRGVTTRVTSCPSGLMVGPGEHAGHEAVGDDRPWPT